MVLDALLVCIPSAAIINFSEITTSMAFASEQVCLIVFCIYF